MVGYAAVKKRIWIVKLTPTVNISFKEKEWWPNGFQVRIYFSNTKYSVEPKRNDGPGVNGCQCLIYFAKTKHSVETNLKKIGSETAVKSEFNSPIVC